MSSVLSSELTTTFKTLVNTMAGDIAGDAPVSRERFTAFSGEVSKIAAAALAEATVAPSTPTKATAPASTDAPKKAAKKKLTTTKSAAPIDEAALLAPVDSEPAMLAAPVATAPVSFVRDAYATHKSRLAKIDETLCMGRKIDVDNPIAGTRKGDTGATFQIYPELQCSKKPVPGGKLCKICAGKHDEYKANTAKVPARYYGLLNEPMFPRALVVGCDMFFTNYPNGIEGDPATAPIKAAAPATAAPATAAPATTAPATTAPATTAPATTAPATKAEEAKVKKPRAKKAAATAPAEASTTASVAATETAPVEPEWVAFLHDDRVHMRNTKDGRVYEAHPGKAGRLEKVNFESYQGRWRDGALDIYAPEKDEE